MCKNNFKSKILSALCALVLLIITNSQVIHSQDIIWGNSIGIFGGAIFNSHSPSMTPSIFTPAVAINNSKNPITGTLGIEGDFQLYPIIVLTGRIGYNWAGVDFESKTLPNTTNNIKTSLHFLEFSPMIKFVNLIPGFEPIYFTTGISLGIPTKKTYSATQNAGRTVRNSNGNIPDTKPRVSLPIGIGYIWKYNWELSIIPEISYNFGFSNISNNINWSTWKLNQLKAGVSITYKIPFWAKNKVKDTIQPAQISIEMDKIYYEDNEQQKTFNSIKLEEAEYGEYFPLIPYIFYDINETNISEKYKQNLPQGTMAGNPNEESFILTDATSACYQVLNIIGKRMQDNSNTSLKVTGTIDAKYETDQQVSELRALAVKDYLVNTFSIDENKITIESLGLPSKPSAQSVPDGIVENRRVELSSNNLELLEPVFVRGERKVIAFPDNITFVPKITTNKSITSWDLKITQTDRLLKHITGNSIDSNLKIRWDIMINELFPSGIPLEYTFEVSTEDTTTSFTGYLSVDYSSISRKKSIEQPDYTINKYSLVLFDFDSPVITDANRKVIDKYIVPNINLGSNIDIYGYTDKIGNSDYNTKLSLSRANSVRDYILTKNRNVPINTYGLGNTAEIFDNENPIGRQLSRTVQVLVITPK